MSLPFIRAATGWLRWDLLKHHVPGAVGMARRGRGLAPNIGMRMVWIGHEQQSVWRRLPRNTCRRIFINQASYKLIANFQEIREGIKNQLAEGISKQLDELIINSGGN